MSRLFKIHVLGGPALTIAQEAEDLEQIAHNLCRHRCIIGELILEGDEPVDTPVKVLIPSNRIHLVAEV